MAGRAIGDEEITRRWQAWTPTDVSQRLAGVTAPWCVTAGWALNLFTDTAARNHDDIEIAVPANRFSDIVAALPAFEWDVVGDGQVWPFPDEYENHFQTWLREPDTGIYHLDVFREPTTGNRWVCRRDARITLPYNELILHTDDGIPYVIPEVALLFKAKHWRHKDQLDFTNVVPALSQARSDRLAGWLSQVHPGHPWINRLATRAH